MTPAKTSSSRAITSPTASPPVAELATEWLGPRTELEIQQTLQREVAQERWTSLIAP